MAEQVLEQLKKKLIQPVKLSEKEIEKFKEIFEELYSFIDSLEQKTLGLDRDEAYRYVDILLRKISEVELEFKTPGVTPKKIPISDPKTVSIPLEPFPDGYFRQLFDQLNTHERNIANKLDCIKLALHFEETGESKPEAPLCRECTLDAMKSCIANEDPSIIDEMDRDLRQAGAQRV